MSYNTILLFGPPGSGKGTWGKVLGSMLGFKHVSSGDMFRGLDPESEIGKKCLSYSEKGNLVPDDLTIELSLDHLAKLKDSGEFDPDNDILLLDGLPRNPQQAEMLDDGMDVKCILELYCSDNEILFSRLKGRAEIEGRADDADPDTIRRRFEVYESQTSSMLSKYSPELVCRIDVAVSIPKILNQISAALVEKIG